jgi:hypothetical protein
MSLSCSCDFDYYDFDYWWEDHSDLKPVKIGRRKRCSSCKELINYGTECIEFYKYRSPRNSIEERIYDTHVPIASNFMCEECSGLYLALSELGYECLSINRSMKNYVAEYNSIHNTKLPE